MFVILLRNMRPVRLALNLYYLFDYTYDVTICPPDVIHCSVELRHFRP